MSARKQNSRIAPLATTIAVVAGSVLTLVVLLLVPKLSGSQRRDFDESVVAVVDGQEIGLDELETAGSAQLQSVDVQRMQCEVNAEKERYRVLNATMEQVVRQRLLEIEAIDRKVSSEVLEAELMASIDVVSQDDIESWYEANKNRVRQPLVDAEDEIREFLQRTRVKTAETRFYDRLKKRYDVDYLLEPFRLQVQDAGHPALGPEDAAVTIVEFSDFECPFCQRVLPTLEQVRKEFGGDVRLVFRQFPLGIHASAMKAAEASLCARDQDMFWEMHDLMFEDQGGLGVAELKAKASELSLDMDAFNKCLDSGGQGDAVKADVQAGSIVGVTGTPAMFVNGRPIEGAVPFDEIAAVISDELARLR